MEQQEFENYLSKNGIVKYYVSMGCMDVMLDDMVSEKFEREAQQLRVQEDVRLPYIIEFSFLGKGKELVIVSYVILFSDEDHKKLYEERVLGRDQKSFGGIKNAEFKISK